MGVWVWPKRSDINSFILCLAQISFPIWNLLVKGWQSLHPFFIKSRTGLHAQLSLLQCMYIWESHLKCRLHRNVNSLAGALLYYRAACQHDGWHDLALNQTGSEVQTILKHFKFQTPKCASIKMFSSRS